MCLRRGMSSESCFTSQVAIMRDSCATTQLAAPQCHVETLTPTFPHAWYKMMERPTTAANLPRRSLLVEKPARRYITQTGRLHYVNCLLFVLLDVGVGPPTLLPSDPTLPSVRDVAGLRLVVNESLGSLRFIATPCNRYKANLMSCIATTVFPNRYTRNDGDASMLHRKKRSACLSK
ncbi:hypothetical protein CFIO01_11920 [Colletotrichum fioriniae PJ7]|uniref:Uncharacterized protein n=1 Tax=Colletotrichum fioriniae PJ7 TaxID=1445577 RepID=A0A010RUD6_9PEZI|nr:hypothetical protein CFIO01_11920 [Colletotrichum fioriniae PJ7]